MSVINRIQVLKATAENNLGLGVSSGFSSAWRNVYMGANSTAPEVLIWNATFAVFPELGDKGCLDAACLASRVANKLGPESTFGGDLSAALFDGTATTSLAATGTAISATVAPTPAPTPPITPSPTNKPTVQNTPWPTTADTVLGNVTFAATASKGASAARIRVLRTTLAATLLIEEREVTRLAVGSSAIKVAGVVTGYAWSVAFGARGSLADLGQASVASWVDRIEFDLSDTAFANDFMGASGLSAFAVTPGTPEARPERRPVPSPQPTASPAPTAPKPTSLDSVAVVAELELTANLKLSDKRKKAIKKTATVKHRPSKIDARHARAALGLLTLWVRNGSMTNLLHSCFCFYLTHRTPSWHPVRSRAAPSCSSFWRGTSSQGRGQASAGT